MPFLVGKADDFRFDRRAVARANAFNRAVTHRCPVQIFPDDAVCFFIRKGQPAAFLIAVFPFRHKGKGVTVCIAFLNGHFLRPQGPPVDAGRRTGFKAHEMEACPEQGSRQVFGRPLSYRAAGVGAFANDYFPL